LDGAGSLPAHISWATFHGYKVRRGKDGFIMAAVKKTQKCPKCRGFGQTTCPKCKGEGEIVVAIDGKPINTKKAAAGK